MELRRINSGVLLLYLTLLVFIGATQTKCPKDVTKPIALTLGTCQHAANAQSFGIELTFGDNNTSSVVCLLPSMMVNNTLLMAKEVCNNDTVSLLACQNRRGGFFDETLLHDPSLDLLAPDPNWALVQNASHYRNFTEAGEVTLSFSDSAGAAHTVPELPVGVIIQGGTQYTGHLGLSFDSTVLLALNQTYNLTNGLNFALDVGLGGSRNGELVLGGYNNAKLGDGTNIFPIANASENTEYVCALRLNIQSIALNFGDTNRNIMLYGTEGGDGSFLPACIDPYYYGLFLPESVVAAFQEVYSGQSKDLGIPAQPPSDLEYAEPALHYTSASASSSFSLIITLDNGYQVTIGDDFMRHELGGYSSDGNLTAVNNITTIDISNSTLVPDLAMLGRIFLSTLYLTVDYEEGNFNLSTLTITSDTDLVPFSSYCVTVTKEKFVWQVWQIYLLIMGIFVFIGLLGACCSGLK